MCRRSVPASRRARAQGRHLGIGFATFSERTGYGSPAFAARGMEITPGWETVEITMDPSGFVEARIGASPHGQGLRTTLAQIIAEEVGVAPHDVRIVHGDTDRTPYGWGTFASRSLVISGGATVLAARKIRDKLVTIASHVLEAAPDDIVLEERRRQSLRHGSLGADRDHCARGLSSDLSLQGHDARPRARTRHYDPSGTFSNACHVAIVEVDIETGRVTIEKFLVAEDAGRIINPMIADGQVHGGIAQGHRQRAARGDRLRRHGGNIQTATLADYMPPTAREVPTIELHHMETPTEASITGAKGLGEGGAIGAPAAVLNAINDALAPFGVSIDEIPATPQRIRAALRAAGAGLTVMPAKAGIRNQRAAARIAWRDATLSRDDLRRFPASHRQIGALDFRIGGQLGHRPLPADLAFLQHVGAVGNELRELDILLRQQDRQAVLLQLDDRVGDLLDDERRDALRRLVEQNKQRIAHQRARDGEHLLFAAAHARAGRCAHLGEVWEKLEQRFRRPGRRRRCRPRNARRSAGRCRDFPPL